MKFGLSESEFVFLNQNLIQPLKDRKAKIFIFGSRACNQHHKFSDIDLLFIEDPTAPIASSYVASLITFFEESHFPYKIDLVDSKSLAQSYRQNVEASKIEI